MISRTIERNIDLLLNVCQDISLAVNTEKTKCMEVGCHQGMMGSNLYEKTKTF